MNEQSQNGFDSLINDAELLKKIIALGFTTATPIQSSCIPAALAGKDVIAQAQTGSGKTLAFIAPLIEKLQTSDPRKTFSLVITPTRELALQIEKVFNSLSDQISPTVLIGGVDFEKQKSSLSKDPRVVIGTPGRILDFLRQKIINLQGCEYFVLDEADEMLSMGFIDDVRAILSKLPKKRQGLFVSATISPRVEMLAQSFLQKPERISIAESEELTPKIVHQFVEVGSDLMAKPQALCDLIEVLRPVSAIIFCNTKSDTKLVEVLLRRRGFDARRINSDLSQSQRDRIMRLIRDEELRFLVATDIAARGIDIEQIDLVVNFNIHDQPETYVHRTGRTGRAGRSGTAISLISAKDWGMFHHLKKVVDFEFQKIELPSDEEVASARLSHLYEILRATSYELTSKDQLVAKKLLSDAGGYQDVSEDLVEHIAKLSRYALEHFVSLDQKSLDEEEVEEKKPSNKKQSDSREKDSANDNKPRENKPRENKPREKRAREDKERPRQERKPRNEREPQAEKEPRQDNQRQDSQRQDSNEQ